MLKIYLASPLGFSPEWKSYRDKIKQRLTQIGYTVLDPWEGPFHTAIAEAGTIQEWPARVAAFKEIAAEIGKANEQMIRSCDFVLGVLDGRNWIRVPQVRSELLLRWERDATACAPISGIAENLTGSLSTCRSCIGSRPAAGSFSEESKTYVCEPCSGMAHEATPGAGRRGK
jgi:hypothetical protein